MRIAIRASIMILLAFACLVPGSARAGDVYGEIRLKDLESGRERPLDRLCSIEVVTGNQRVRTTSQPGARYLIHVAAEGRFTLELRYRGRVLETQISSWYSPNWWDLIIEYLEDEYRLRANFVREYHEQPYKE